jgi:hypothetical protein
MFIISLRTHRNHNPDNQLLPVFAVNHSFLGNKWSTHHKRLLILPYDAAARLLVPFQASLYGASTSTSNPGNSCFQGQGLRKGLAWWHSLLWSSRKSSLVILVRLPHCLPIHTQTLSRSDFMMISHMNHDQHASPLPAHSIPLCYVGNRFGTNRVFPQKMLRTTMDVDCPQWLHFFYGDLQFQDIHHLFLRIPSVWDGGRSWFRSSARVLKFRIHCMGSCRRQSAEVRTRLLFWPVPKKCGREKWYLSNSRLDISLPVSGSERHTFQAHPVGEHGKVSSARYTSTPFGTSAPPCNSLMVRDWIVELTMATRLMTTFPVSWKFSFFFIPLRTVP